MRLSSPTLQIFCNTRTLQETTYIDKIPSNFPFIRKCSQRVNPDFEISAGLYYFDKNIYTLVFIFPDSYNPDDVRSSTLYTYRKNNVPCFITNNDCVIRDHNDYVRKFAGMNFDKYPKEKRLSDYLIHCIDISYKIDYDFMNMVVNKKLDKLAKKTNLNNDFCNILIGLNDYNPTLNPYDDIRDIVYNYASRYKLDVVEDQFSDEEYRKIEDLANLLGKDSWLYDRIHPLYGYLGE